MADDHEFRIRPGRIRSTKAQSAGPFIAQALAAAKKAGGGVSRSGRVGVGEPVPLWARPARQRPGELRFITARTRSAVIKARVVRHRLAPRRWARISIICAAMVSPGTEKARLFEVGKRGSRWAVPSPSGARTIAIISVSSSRRTTPGRCRTSNPSPATWSAQMEKDLDTRLDWVAVDHWNTEHPHVHLIVRGVREDGQDLVISRDYIKEGMRDRARGSHHAGAGAAHRTSTSAAPGKPDRGGALDAARSPARPRRRQAPASSTSRRRPAASRTNSTRREGGPPAQAGERSASPSEIGPGQWMIDDKAEATMRELGERGDIIKRMHRALDGSRHRARLGELRSGRRKPRRRRSSAGSSARGLDDELKGTAYAVVDGVDGRSHHIKLSDLDAAGDSTPGSIVELRKFDDARGRRRVALAVRSDLDLERQVTATGATWLDRQAIAREPVALVRRRLRRRGAATPWIGAPNISSAEVSPSGSSSGVSFTAAT